MAIVVVTMPLPKMLTITRTSTMDGIARTTSRKRMKLCSTAPPARAAIIPTVVPAREIKTTIPIVISRDDFPPYKSLDRKHRPSWSVPRGYCPDESRSAWSAWISIGLLGANWGANRKNITKRMLSVSNRQNILLSIIFFIQIFIPLFLLTWL